jgi:hypothetical protein
MLTLNNVWISQFEVKNNRLHSASRVSEKNTSPTGRTTSCTEWYLITTFYYADGSSSQTEEYLGTTCTGSGDGSGCNTNPGEPQVPCGDNGGGGPDENATERVDETISGGRSDLDPLFGEHIVPVKFAALVWVYYLVNTRQIVLMVPQRPFAIPPAQTFVDADGKYAHASCTIDPAYSTNFYYVMGGKQAWMTYDFGQDGIILIQTGLRDPVLSPSN